MDPALNARKVEMSRSLGKACAKGDFDEVTQLIKEGHNLEEQVKYSHRSWRGTDKPVRECTPLIIASSEGHLDIVRKLISAGANVDAKDACPEMRRTPLHYACSLGHRSVALVLLDNGCRPNERDHNLKTPLMLALIFGYEDIALEVISRLGEDVGVKDSEGRSALFYAHKKTFKKCIEMLLSKLDQGNEEDREVIEARAWLEDFNKKQLCGACSDGDLTKVKQLIRNGYNIEELAEYLHPLLLVEVAIDHWITTPKCPPLSIASSKGHLYIVQELITAGADVHTKDTVYGMTALHHACVSGHLRVAQLLLNSVSRLNKPDEYDNCTPLILATQFGHEEVVSELLSRGADIHAKSKEHGRTALHWACEKGHMKCVQLLLNAGSRLNEPDEYYNWTPLILATQFGHEEVVSELLSRGADIHAKSKVNGRTALHWACKMRHMKCVQLLLNAGSRLNEPDKFDNWTPLILATQFGHEEVVSELLSREADIHAKSKEDGRTALHWACEKGHMKCVQLLLNAGSRLNEPDEYYNWTPLILATQFGHEEVVSELLSRGADIHAKSKVNGRTALHWACKMRHMKCVQLLLNAGSRLNEPDKFDNWTPLILATQFGHEEVVSELLSREADIHAKSKEDGRTALHWACEKGHMKCVQLLLNAGSRLNEPDEFDNWTPLILAIKFGHEEVVSELLSRGADIHAKSKKYGRIALHWACKKGHMKCVQLLLNAGSRLNEPDEYYNWTPLILATQFGHEEVVSELLSRGADIHAKSKVNGCTALHWACKMRHMKCVRLLLNAGSRLNEPDEFDNWTPLILAIQFGHEEVVSELLSRGADIHAKSKKYGRIALHWACKKGHMKCVQLLLNAGSRLNEPDEYYNWTPLILATQFGHEEVVSELLSRGADIHAKSKVNGRTALHWACKMRHMKCVQLLLNAGSRLNEPDKFDNWTPLILATQFGHEEVVSELLSREADIHAKSKEDGRTALHWACEKGHMKCVQLLLNAGSRLNEPDEIDNWTPLILATQFGHEEVVSELLSRGADIHAKSKKYGRTALHWACKKGHMKCVQLLLNAGSRLNEPDEFDNYTPLILATQFGHEEVVSELLSRGADIHAKSKEDGRTALHWACKTGHLKWVQLLLNAGSRLNEPDSSGCTPLHLSVGHFEVLQYLIQKGCSILIRNRNGLTALDLITKDGLYFEKGVVKLSQMELLAKAGCKATLYKVHEIIKEIVQEANISPKKAVCVIGHSCSGKSTLIAALTRNSSTSGIARTLKKWQKINTVTKRTAGIEPISFEGQRYGETLFYDFAGQHDYHGPHQTFLEALVKRPGTTLTVLLLVKATEEENVMFQQMIRWLQPISWIYSPESTIQVTVVGSFADQVKDLNQAKDKLRKCSKSVVNNEIANVSFTNSVLLDCRKIYSDKIDQIWSIIQQSQVSTTLYSLSESKSYNVHWVLHHLKQVKELALSTDILLDWLNINEVHPHISENDVLSLCKDLSSTGHVLFLENKHDPRKSWLVLQLDKILHEMYGTLFTKITPNSINKFGLVHVDQILSLFPNYEQHFVVTLLTSMDFCHEVDPSIFQEDILPTDQREGWLFFPCLITARPTMYFPQEDSSSEHKCLCWQVNTPRSKFFSPRLLQAALLSLTTHQTVFKRDNPSKIEAMNLPEIPSTMQPMALQVKEHCCKLWWNGITWHTTSGVQIVVQFFDNTIAQVIARIPHEIDPSVLVRCVSSVATDILCTVKQLYPDLMSHLEAYIISSTDHNELCTNPRLPDPHEKFQISDIAKVLSEGSTISENLFCPSLTKDGEQSVKPIRELFCGNIPSLDIVAAMNPLEIGLSSPDSIPKEAVEVSSDRLHSTGSGPSSSVTDPVLKSESTTVTPDIIATGNSLENALHPKQESVEKPPIHKSRGIIDGNDKLTSVNGSDSQERIKTFISSPAFHDCLHDSCDIRRIATKLHSTDAISRDELDKMAPHKGLKEANSSLYIALVSDPRVTKLKLVSKALKDDVTHEGHQTLAKRIDKFLRGTYVATYV